MDWCTRCFLVWRSSVACVSWFGSPGFCCCLTVIVPTFYCCILAVFIDPSTHGFVPQFLYPPSLSLPLSVWHAYTMNPHAYAHICVPVCESIFIRVGVGYTCVLAVFHTSCCKFVTYCYFSALCGRRKLKWRNCQDSDPKHI